MRVRVSIAVLLAATWLVACSKPAASSASSDQPSAPTEPASAPSQPTPADIKAALADLPPAYQSADVDNGEAKFALCKSCHTANDGGSDMIGPNLYGVFGRKAGTRPGFSYSDSMKAAGYAWDADHLDKWLTNPAATIPGTKMTFAGLPDAKDRADVIAYLKVATTPRKTS